MSTLIHTYRTSCKTVAQPPGFGDFLRGTVALHQLSQKYDFQLETDFSHHPLSQYLDCPNPETLNDEYVHEFFNQNNAALEPFLRTLSQDSHYYVTTHCVPLSKISETCRRFMRKRLTPNYHLKAMLKDIMQQLGRDFCTVHLRMGDHVIDGGDARVPLIVETWFRDLIVPKWGNRILVLSDNCAVKELLSERFGVMFIPNIPVHLGQCGTADSPRVGVLDTLLDFFIMARSKVIYQYSVYPWGSGFSDMCSLIYRIPLVKILSGS